MYDSGIRGHMHQTHPAHTSLVFLSRKKNRGETLFHLGFFPKECTLEILRLTHSQCDAESLVLTENQQSGSVQVRQTSTHTRSVDTPIENVQTGIHFETSRQRVR